MQITLVRHTKVDVGESICYGQSDVGLADDFHEKSHSIKHALADRTFSSLYSSPLSRCLLLAKKISDLTPNIDDRLMELNFGDWENMAWLSVSKTEQAKKWFADSVNTPFPNGESFADLIERTRGFISSLKETHDDQSKLLIVTHAGIIRAFHIIIEKLDPAEGMALPLEFGDIKELSI